MVLTFDVFPDLAVLHAARPARYPHLLESVARGSSRARYDILFAFPGSTLTLTERGLLRDSQPADTGFLPALDQAWRQEGQAALSRESGTLPFSGGWFVFLGYELAPEIEPSLGPSVSGSLLPVAFATRFRSAIIRDHETHRTHLICEDGCEALLDDMRADLMKASGTNEAAPILLVGVDEDAPEQFLDGVSRVLDYIRAGDVFQVNLSRQWCAHLAETPAPVDLYRRLRDANPAPFAGLVTIGNGRALISSSPERLVEVRGSAVSTRPIAGTHPRGDDALADDQLAAALLRHPKERAEHVMLIDLERNDLGRVCRPGSVQVTELMTLESYRHVHHIVSEVRGELREGAGPVDVIRAVFPGGTITGCPKVRCMQIIRELEAAPRSAYTGSIGYINRDGSMDLNILIRTLVQNGKEISLRAGAGIVADSNPQRELAETRAKARGLLAALGIPA